MALMPQDTGHATKIPEEGQLKCPHCRRVSDGDLHWGVARCADCGYRLIASTRQSEADAWQRLYDRPPR